MKISKIEKMKLRTWVEIDREAIKKNYRTFKRIVGNKCILMAVVKSNAYGHGLTLFAQEVVKQGINFLGVDSFEEALELRASGIKVRILVFGYVSPAYFKEAARKNISLTISNFPTLLALQNTKINSELKIHIKVDTGLGRQGFLMKDMQKVVSALKLVKNIKVEGLYSHLAVGEDIKGRKYTMLQANRLNEWEKGFKEAGYQPLKHIAATSSTMFFPELHFDMVRVGIGMYGLWPSKETKQVMQKNLTLHPVLSWKAVITEIKQLPKGTKVGYDLAEKLKRDSLLGVVPVGYWHGYSRSLSGKGIFQVGNKEAKIVGRVSMDMVVVDLTGVKVSAGDEVSIMGGAHGKYLEADQIAKDSNTINYEIITRINPIIKRFLR